MTVTSPPSAGGGFLLSPPASSTISSTTSTLTALPHPRNSPLRRGGAKESALIRHLDQQILHIQRRFAKRTTSRTDPPSALTDHTHVSEPLGGYGSTNVAGYETMGAACSDVSALVAVIWVSGTPGVQIPYLTRLALLLGDVVKEMPPSPRALFRVLGQLDHAFASLLQGRDIESGERLPGFEGGRGVSGTEKVRIRSLAERMRVLVVEAFKKGEFELEDGETDDGDEHRTDRMDTDTETDDDLGPGYEYANKQMDRDDEEEDTWDMQIARVFDRTILELGDSLEEPSIGIITEGRG